MNFLSTPAVPSRAELFLGALGANTEFCEMVVGDMSEEFAIRAEWDGLSAARRWYYSEVVRVAPYLLRDWMRSVRGKDLASVACTVMFSSVAGIAFEHVMLSSFQAAGAVAGTHYGALMRSSVLWASVIHPALMALCTLGDGIVSGYVAARIGKRAPIPSAIALASAWIVVIAALNIAGGQLGFAAVAPVWYKVANVVAVVGGVIAGSVLRASRAPIANGQRV